MKTLLKLTALVVIVSATAAIAQPRLSPAGVRILKEQPPAGKLRFGQQILVDDGSCGRSKILLVTGAPRVGVKRGYECVSMQREEARKAPSGLQVLKQEPPAGSLRDGEERLVDNGYCMTGFILLLTGAPDHKTPRGRECVVR